MPDERGGAGLYIESVSYRYVDAEPVLDEISFKLKPGEFVAILGPSGCGKSTLIRLLSALDPCRSGRLQIDPADASRGVVFQEPRLLPWRTVFGNVRLPLELLKIDAKTADERALAAVQAIGLADALHKYPRELSGGMKMRAAVARALVTRPPLLLLDEPFAALDEHSRTALQDDLRTLWEQERMTVVLVTHALAEAAFLANRVLALSRRPARVLNDLAIELPLSRPSTIRREPIFHAELARLRRFVGGQGAEAVPS